MKCVIQAAALFIALVASGQVVAGDPCCDSPHHCLFGKFAPVGGWHPDSGGLLHWWPRGCFPCCGACDDYCRKPPPAVCWPCYPGYYSFGPPEICYEACGCGSCGKGGLPPIINAGKP